MVATYQPKTEQRKLTLQNQLFDSSRALKGDLDAYIYDVEDTAKQLADIGVDIPEQVILNLILNGLPDEYDPFVTALQLQDKIILDDALEQLKRYKEMKVARDKSRSDAALVAREFRGHCHKWWWIPEELYRPVLEVQQDGSQVSGLQVHARRKSRWRTVRKPTQPWSQTKRRWTTNR